MMKLPYIKVAIPQLFMKPSTENFPTVMKEAPEKYRGRIKYYPDRCINCGMCERVCAGQAISKTIEHTEEGDRITLTFDMNSCAFCGFCADFCSRFAIELTKDYLMVAAGEDRIVETGSFIKKPPVKAPPKQAAAPAATTEVVAAQAADSPASETQE